MNDLPNRKWPRLKNYDYSTEGYYFITICTQDRKPILSEIVRTSDVSFDVSLTDYGRTAESFLKAINGIDKYVIMPNHIHMIIHKTNGKNIANDIRSFKGLTTKKIGRPIWQQYYYDHVIRDKDDYLIKWNYIIENPLKWGDDEYSKIQ